MFYPNKTLVSHYEGPLAPQNRPLISYSLITSASDAMEPGRFNISCLPAHYEGLFRWKVSYLRIIRYASLLIGAIRVVTIASAAMIGINATAHNNSYVKLRIFVNDTAQGAIGDDSAKTKNGEYGLSHGRSHAESDGRHSP